MSRRYVVTVLVHLNRDVVVEADSPEAAEDAVVAAQYDHWGEDVALAEALDVVDLEVAAGVVAEAEAGGGMPPRELSADEAEALGFDPGLRFGPDCDLGHLRRGLPHRLGCRPVAVWDRCHACGEPASEDDEDDYVEDGGLVWHRRCEPSHA